MARTLIENKQRFGIVPAFVAAQDLSANDIRVYIALAVHVDKRSRQCWVRISGIAEICCMDECDVRQSVGSLAQTGLIARGNEDGEDAPFVYVLLDENVFRMMQVANPGRKDGTSRWSRIRAFVFDRDNHTCQYCGKTGVAMDCDHVMPRALGGGDEYENLATACPQCNRSKRDKSPEEWAAIVAGRKHDA